MIITRHDVSIASSVHCRVELMMSIIEMVYLFERLPCRVWHPEVADNGGNKVLAT